MANRAAMVRAVASVDFAEGRRLGDTKAAKHQQRNRRLPKFCPGLHLISSIEDLPDGSYVYTDPEAGSHNGNSR